MVAYPVGMHGDHFHDGESLEIKTLFTILLRKGGSVGGDGSILDNRFVFALLDW